MAGEALFTALTALINALFLIAGVYVYVALARQVAARSDTAPTDGARSFGLPDAFLALALGTLFLLNAVAAALAPQKQLAMRNADLVFNGIISLGFGLFVAAFLAVRRLDVNALAGFAKLSFARTLITAGVLLFLAYPLIFIADVVTQRLFGAPSSRQGIVELFNDSATLEQRVLIIVLAVAIAPMVEEFLFRFFIYGVLKRYFGRLVGLLVNAGVFAAVHAHLPSAAPLFVLGACFTLAYEWSGSIVVCMAMHALFNSLTLTALAFPDVFRP